MQATAATALGTYYMLLVLIYLKGCLGQQCTTYLHIVLARFT